MVEQLAFAEVLPSMEYKEVKSTVVKMLKRYKKLPHMIAAAERRAKGRGINRKIDKKKQEQIAAAVNPLLLQTKGIVYQEKALTLVDQAMRNHPDEEVLEQVNDVLLGVRPWGYDGALDPTYCVVPIQNAWEDVYNLQDELDSIEFALERLKAYEPELEKLLRLRFIEDEKVETVANELGISKRTYDSRRDEAIAEFAMLAGVTEG